jgi:hypothetical protein
MKIACSEYTTGWRVAMRDVVKVLRNAAENYSRHDRTGAAAACREQATLFEALLEAHEKASTP